MIIQITLKLNRMLGWTHLLISFQEDPALIICNILLIHKQTKRQADSYKNIYLFGLLRCFQHCTGHMTTGSWKGRGNQYIKLVKVLYCKLLAKGKPLSYLRSGRDSNSDLRGGRRVCYYCASMAPVIKMIPPWWR